MEHWMALDLESKKEHGRMEAWKEFEKEGPMESKKGLQWSASNSGLVIQKANPKGSRRADQKAYWMG
jgi:hypothetical protein